MREDLAVIAPKQTCLGNSEVDFIKSNMLHCSLKGAKEHTALGSVHQLSTSIDF